MAVTAYPIDTIARLLDLTPRRVQQLSADGVIPRGEKGRYELVPAVRGYIKFLRERAMSSEVGADAFAQHRSRLTKARADMAEMESRQLTGELIPAEDIEQAWTAVTANLRARLLAIPSKLAARVLAAKNAVEAQDLIRAQINEALEELSAVHIEVAAPLRASDPGEDSDGGDEAAEASADPDDLTMG